MKYLLSSFVVFILSVPMYVFGISHQVLTDPPPSRTILTDPVSTKEPVSLINPLGDVTLTGLFQIILNVVMIFAVPLIVFFIIYAGFKYVTARGNEQAISEAHKALLYALIGGVLILGANVLIEVIQGTVDSVIK